MNKKNENDGINYKAKYYDLKSRYVDSIDVAYRNGYEQGYTQAQIDTQMQQMQMQMAQGGGVNMTPPQGAMAQGEEQKGSQIDQYIQALEAELNKAEPNLGEIKKFSEAIKLQKSMQDVKTINPFQPKPYQTSQGYKSMSGQDRKALDMQANIVDDIIAKWEKEEQDAAKQTDALLNTEILRKALEFK